MDSDSIKLSLLSSTLQLAVPLWINQLRGSRWDYIISRAKLCCEVIAHKGDIILYKSKKKGETAEAFNRLAEGIACLSFCPGGVKIFGDHWESCIESDEVIEVPKALFNLIDSLKKFLNAEIEIQEKRVDQEKRVGKRSVRKKLKKQTRKKLNK